MKASMLHEIANVARCDSDAIVDHYAWPPKVMTDEERREADRLFVLSLRVRQHAYAAAYEEASR